MTNVESTWIEVFKHLPLADLINCKKVCKEWNRIASEDAYYDKFCWELCPRFPRWKTWRLTLRRLLALNFLKNTFGMPGDLLEICQAKILHCCDNGDHKDRIYESFKYLENPQFINLRENNLGEIPEHVFNYTAFSANLKRLHLCLNNLRALPHSIGNLNNLIYLDISNNLLKELPDSIGKLTKLKELNVSNNLLESLPDSIIDLLNLEYLNFIGNNIELLPNSLENMPNLRAINYSFNRIKKENIPPRLLCIAQ